MKNLIILVVVLVTISCKTKEINIETVASFKGQQVTGVTVSDKGRIFANFPRWRTGVENSVVEIKAGGEAVAFPAKNWNTWEVGENITDSIFVAVQSVVAFENTLYVLDTRNPLFSGVIGQPKIFVFNLNSNKLIKEYTLSLKSFHDDSYINDLRIDKKNGKIYLTDSGHAGLVVLDINSGESFRVLDNHKSTLAEVNQLSFDNGIWESSVHSDGIALDAKNDMLYYHALTGYSLFAIPTEILISGNNDEIEENVRLVAKTSAPDGMIFDNDGNLILADIENNKIIKFNTSSKKTSVIAKGDKVKWADTFSIHNNYLYYTNSRINEDKGDVSKLMFTINKIRLN